MGFTESGRLKVFDFSMGLCVKRSSVLNQRYEMSGICDAPVYAAPEAVLWQPYNEKVDVYSMGMIFWQLLCGGGLPPFAGLRAEDYLLQAVGAGERPLIGPEVDPRLASLIERCWHADPDRRPSAAAIFAIVEDLLEEGPMIRRLVRTLHGLFRRRGSKVLPVD
jgi:serine/threonine protein kinase